MVTQNSSVYRYQVDDADVISAVDDWWLAFARENGSPQWDAASVVGQSIWDFIAGEPTQTLYRELHQYVRQSGTPVTVPFRCDSPILQRYMQLTIHREDSGSLLYESELLRVEPQRRMHVLDGGVKRSSDVLTMCSCCKRSLLEPSGWLDLADISLRLRLFDDQAVPDLRYTICPECARQRNEDRTGNPV